MRTVEPIGKFVQERRKAAGLTQRELAELAGVGTRFISDLERGKSTVRLAEVNAELSTKRYAGPPRSNH